MEHIADLVRRAEQHLRVVSGSLLETDITPPQSRVMRSLFEAQRQMSQIEITQSTGIDRSTLSELIRRLVGRGLVTRERSQSDARAYDVKLTTLGIERIESLVAQGERLNAKIAACTTEDDRAAALRFLHAICTMKVK